MKSLKISTFIKQSLDGYIARFQEDKLEWGSNEDKIMFRQRTSKIGVVIIGSNTFIQTPISYFDDKFTLVMTSKPEKFKSTEKMLFFKGNPEEAINKLAELGYKEAALVGGGKLINSFLQAKLVDEICVTVSNVIFGQGISGYGDQKLSVNLALKSVERLGNQDLLLNYQVVN